MPFLAGASLARRQAAQRAAVGMTKTVVNPLVSSSVTVDRSDVRRAQLHRVELLVGRPAPNDAGYAFISSEVVKAITSSSYPAPQSSCAGMTIVP